MWRARGKALTRWRFVTSAGTSAIALELALYAGAVRTDSMQEATVAEAPAQESNLVLNVNGTAHSLTLEPRVTLLDALRDRIGLTGTKKGCDQGTCGASTVMVNGRRILSCLTLAVMHASDRTVTVEGVAEGEPVAVVIAESFEAATYGADLLRVEYQAERPELTFDTAPRYVPAKVFGDPATYRRLRGSKSTPISARFALRGSSFGVAAAVANAVYHATGIRVRELPITLDKPLA
jgi:hypothetical protein